uniref:Uncharacterized protein n=1 Tax=Octopus bimaculoides TaxID=37653 RepID=A0A0L8HM29_OCTBM
MFRRQRTLADTILVSKMTIPEYNFGKLLYPAHIPGVFLYGFTKCETSFEE